MLHTKVYGNRSTGSKEEDFKNFYHIRARNPPGHVTNTCFHSLYLKAYMQNLEEKKVKCSLRKTSFNFYMKMTLGQSQEMTLKTHILLSTHLVVCIY